MFKKILSALLAAVMLLSVAACTGKVEEKPVSPADEVKLDYTFGETFKSDVPVTYSMYFSDASWYPMVDTWKTEGVFAKITEKTNVTLDITAYDSGDYTNKIGLDINSGNSKYIIPKVYDEAAFVDGGALIPVSDYFDYMPNFSAFRDKYSLQPELKTIIRSDGNIYRLPGMHETAWQDYTLCVRKDIFDAAGVDVTALEKDWTWDGLYDALVTVKEYMVAQGLCSAKDYIWSDTWAGSEEVAKGAGGNLLNLIGTSYGIQAGWGLHNSTGLIFDSAKDEWYLGSASDNYKDFVTVVNKFVKGGILDPETFTQDNTTANDKFFTGKTIIHSVNRSQYATYLTGLDTNVGAGNYDLYLTVYPMGNNRYIAENNRLECGVCISRNALDDLGEDEFIKMMRFVDWLFYSDEAYDLIKWGVEGETYEYTTDAETGLTIKKLCDGYKCGGLGISGGDELVDIRLQWGYAGGNFWYGHSAAQVSDNFIPVLQQFYQRVGEYRENRPVDPAVTKSEDDNEQLNLWKTPLIDNIDTWTLNFITGAKDINADWDAYLDSLKNLNAEAYTQLYNDCYKATK